MKFCNLRYDIIVRDMPCVSEWPMVLELFEKKNFRQKSFP